MPIPWVDKEQTKFLVDRMVIFVRHQSDKDVTAFFTSLQNEWYDLWPLEITGVNGVALTEKEISQARRVRNKQLRNWYNNNQRKNAAAGAGSRGFWRLNATPIKVLAPAQAYSSYHYQELIKPEVIRLWKELLLREDNFDYVGSTDDDEGLVPEEIDDTTADIPIGFIMDTVKKMYAEASEEMKASVESRRKEEGSPLNHVTDPVLRQEILRGVMQTMGSFDTTMSNIMQNIVRATGMNVHILLAGPVPSLAGEVSSFSYGSGATPDGTEFYNLPNFQTDVLNPFAAHAHNCFSAEVCASRALLPEAESDDDAAPTTLTNTFLKKPAKGRKKQAKKTKSVRYPDSINGIRYRKSTGNSDDLENSTGSSDFPISSSPKEKSPKASTLVASAPVPTTMFFGDGSTFAKPPQEMAPLPPVNFDPSVPFVFQGAEFEDFIANNLDMAMDFSNSNLGSFNTSTKSDLSAFSSFLSSPSLSDSTTHAAPSTSAPSAGSFTSTSASTNPASGAPVPTLTAVIEPIVTIHTATPISEPLASTVFPALVKSKIHSVTPVSIIAPIPKPSVPIVPATLKPQVPIPPLAVPIPPLAVPIPPLAVPIPPLAVPIPPVDPKPVSQTLQVVKKASRRDNPIWPDWLNKAAKYLDSASSSPAWNNLLKALFEHEESLGLGVGAPYTLDWDEAPTEINWWQAEGHGDTARYPHIELPDFGSRTRQWWLSLQPAWRGPLLLRIAPADHTWLPQYKVGGPRGLFLMVMCMSWWARSLTKDSSDFNAILADLTWVLQQSDSPAPGTAVPGRRSARGLQANNTIDPPIPKPRGKPVKRPATAKVAAPAAKKVRHK